MNMAYDLTDFVRESNRIEGIVREPTLEEVVATQRFMNLTEITINAIEDLVAVYQPGARLRDKSGLNVMIGTYHPPRGGPQVRELLDALLFEIDRAGIDAFSAHVRYELLHPFTDGNGRSGRALWLWQMRGYTPLGFLHHFYYQTLKAQQ